MLLVQMPVIEEVGTEKDNKQKFSIGPLEPGFGHTMGNSLRRVLLSSLVGSAPTSVHIEGVASEFDSIPGVTEDVADIILNLKDVIMKMDGDEAKVLNVDFKGPGELKAGDLVANNSEIEVLNPDLHIAKLGSAKKFTAEITLEKGRGYLPAPTTGSSTHSRVGMINMDAIFSPVRRVSYVVELTQVEQSIEYDQLIIEIETDGSISPKDALATAGGTLGSLSGLIEQFGQEPQALEFVQDEEQEVPEELQKSILTLDLSERGRHCLERAEIATIGELVQKTQEDLLSLTNFGQTSLNEVIFKLDELGLTLSDGTEKIE